MKNVIIVGYGQIGKSIHGLFNRADPDQRFCTVYRQGRDWVDRIVNIEEFDIMHIAFTYTKEFIQSAIDYIKEYKPKLVIIHSTVPPGTTRKIWEVTKVNMAMSPVMGVHPYLAESMLTFRKIVGAVDKISLKEAYLHLEELGMNIAPYDSTEEAELAKMLSTTYYGHNIRFMQEVYSLCEKMGLNFKNVYTNTNMIYNEGYKDKKMARKNVIRPVLEYTGEGCGGHCVVENATILNELDLLPDITKHIVAMGKPKK